MKIITVITQPNNLFYASILKPSVELQGLELIALAPSEGYASHRAKDQALCQYLEGIPDEEVIFFTDGYDTLLLAAENEIMTKYRLLEKEIIFSAEGVCWPDEELAGRYPSSESPFKYLNSGGFIGKSGAIKKFISENLQTESIRKFSFSNQVYWTEQYLRNQDKIGLDTQCKLFCTLSSDQDSVFRNIRGNRNLSDFADLKTKWFNQNFSFHHKRLFVNVTAEMPCQVHFNGWTKVLLPEVLKNSPFEGEYKEKLLWKLNKMGEYLFSEQATLLN